MCICVPNSRNFNKLLELIKLNAALCFSLFFLILPVIATAGEEMKRTKCNEQKMDVRGIKFMANLFLNINVNKEIGQQNSR